MAPEVSLQMDRGAAHHINGHLRSVALTNSIGSNAERCLFEYAKNADVKGNGSAAERD